MSFTKIQEDIIRLVLEFNEDPRDCIHEPCIEQIQTHFKNKYAPLEIEGNVLKLISKGVLEPYSYQSHLRFTERFRNKDNYRQLIKSLSYT